jgi:LmbE family N-acetylglucosaminyl deacetylase
MAPIFHRMKYIFLNLTVLFLLPFAQLHAEDDGGKLRIMVIGGHPDDAEYKAGGTAVKWAKLGHHVKLVSATNGDLSDRKGTREEIATRREAEVIACARKLGVTAQVLDIPDGELVPDLETRKLFVRVIREWRADIVIGHRLSDYHPDHRAAAQLIQDCSFLVTASRFCPDAPALDSMPVFLLTSDKFTTPHPFEPDIAVALDEVFDQKLDGLHEIESQVYERRGGTSVAPAASDETARRFWLKNRWSGRQRKEADKYRELLVELYGEEKGRAVQFAETFELSEYGRQPTPKELRTKLFPFFGAE